MTGRTFLFLGLLVALIDVGIPYLLLRDAASFAGGFLFWTVLPALGIVAAFFYTRPWSER